MMIVICVRLPRALLQFMLTTGVLLCHTLTYTCFTLCSATACVVVVVRS